MSYYGKGYRKKISLGENGNTLITLIAVNLIIFVILAFIKVIFFFLYQDNQLGLSFYNKNVLSWFTLPADIHSLVRKPWTIITHMFVHDGLWHIFGNMLWLWCFGYIMQDLTGNRKIVPIFLYGGLAGAFAFVLSYNFLPVLQAQLPFATALGASAGIMALAVATTVVAPGYRIFPLLGGGIPLWILTVFYIIIDLASIPYNNTGGHIAHLAGAAMGFLFIFFLRRGYDWSDWMNNVADWFGNLFNPARPKREKKIKDELFYKSSSKPYHKTPNITQKRIDEILDKISQKGYNFLTDEEKELLKRASKEDK